MEFVLQVTADGSSEEEDDGEEEEEEEGVVGLIWLLYWCRPVAWRHKQAWGLTQMAVERQMISPVGLVHDFTHWFVTSHVHS